MKTRNLFTALIIVIAIVLWNVLLTQSSPLGSSDIWDGKPAASSDERQNADEPDAPLATDLTTISTSEALDASFFTFLPTDDMEANVGYTGFFRFDNPMDNLFTITIDQEPDEGTEVYLEYELFGVTDYTGVCMSLNDAPSFGGMIVKKNESWSTQREQIPASQLHKGDNVIRFTSFPSASYGYTVRDLKLRMAKAGPVCERQIILSQPGEGIYYGNKAYVKGLVCGTGSSLATIRCDGRQVSTVGGSFEVLLDKPEGKGKKWKTTIQATFEDGEMITRELRFDKEASFDLLNDLQEPVSLDEQVAVPELSFELATAGARLAGQSQAVYETMDMSIRTLRSNDVLPAASGMINVTGNARGFRCLPHGTRFQQDITIEIPYTADIPIGYKPQDIFTYYFDEPSRRWVRIQRDSVDTERGVIISKVDHFTDFINGIIKVPEAPTTNAYTPTSIKDLQVANPMDGIPIFQPPTPNNMGTAELSYPILVPPGRNGMQPIINLTYSSEKVNSWLGLGWDINLPAITVETRWGVPRFDPELESETYLLNGSQLAILDTSGRFKEMSHRGVWESRKTDVRYFRRTEGAFDKIIRHGNMPSNYWWEVIAPDGTKYYYGKSITSDAVSSEILESAIDNVVHWPLTMIVDQYGNSIIYDYVVVQDYGPSGASVMGRQIYINKIYYTGRGSNPGEYSVEFTRMDKSKFERKDKIISGRRGLKEVTGDLLQKVEVWFQDSTLVRSYFFSYHTGDFGKTLLNGFALTDSIGHRILDSVIVQDPSSVQSYLNVETVPSGIIPYTFEYKNEDEPLQYFDNVANTITTYDVDAAGSLGFGFESNPTSLGGNQSVGSNLNLGFDVGIGFEALSKSNSIGGSGSGSWSKSIGLLTMADINGDNLPDKIYIDRESELLMYRLHYLHEGIHDFGEEDTIFNIDLFSESSTNTPSLGWEVQGQIGPVSGGINKNYNQANTSTTTFFTDVNGDGILDIAKFGLVYFNAPVKKEGVMHPSFSLVTNNTVWIGGSCDSISFSGTIPQDFTKPGIDTIYIVNDSGDITSYFDTLHPDSSFYPDLEAVRVWVAPYEGTVSIQGTIEISPDYQALRKSQFFLDGLRASIQVVDSVYLSDTLYPIGDSITQYSLTGIHIEAGDRIYFRTQSLAERIYDKVIWDPVVNYTYCDDFPVISGAKNADGLDVFSFRASEGFVLSDPMLLKFPIDGTVRLLNTIQYNGSPSDTVFLQIFHNDPDSLAWSDTLSSQISASYQSDRDSLPVLQGDSLWCLAYSKSNVDWQSLYWDFALEYIYTPDTNIGALIDSSDPGNPKASIRYDIVTNKYIYNRDVLPTCSFTPSSTLNATVNPVITLSGNMGVDTVYFTIKSAGNLEKRRIVSVDDDTAFSQGFNYTFIQGTEYYLDFWCDNPDLTDALTSAKCTINTNPYDCGLHSIYEDTLAIFGPLYQGWGQFCYNSIGTNPYSIVEDSLKPSKRFLDPNITIIVDTGNILHCDSQLAAGAHYSPWTENFNVLFADPLNKFYGCLNVVSVDTFSQQHFSEFGFEEGISITHSPFPAVSSEMAVSIFPYSRNEFKTSSSSAGAFTVGYGKSETEGNIYNRSDFLDLNGDRYPDIFWRGRVIYSKPQGGLSKGVFGTNTPSRATQQTFYTAEGTSYLGSDILGEKNGRDKPQLTIRATGSLAIDGAEGESYDVFKMIDINGDGLLDKVKGDGHLSMNIGYNSLNYEDWNIDDVYHNVSDNFTLGGSVGASGITTAMADYLGEQKEYQKDGYSLALGLGGNWGKAFTDATFIDINGDGLVDRIRDNITAPGSGDCAIEINSGMGYETPVTASGLKSAHFSKSINTYVNGAGTIGVAIPIPFIGAIKFVMNGQGGKSWNVSQEKEQLIDINADGLPDYVYSDKVDEINVRYNTCGKRNFLLRIHNPGLSSIHLDYELSEHIWDNPDRSYLLTEIKTSDGFEGDGPDYKTAIVEYGNGRYDRYEREFLGYDTVRVTDYDSLSLGYVAPYRVSEVHYYNHNILFRGQKFYDVTKAGDGTIFAENYYDVKLTEILSGDSIPGGLLFCYGDGYPAIHSQQSTFTEGLSSTHITQIQEFDYGPFGNIEGFYQGGDETLLSDDYYTEIYYHSDTTKYIVSVADSIVVKDHSSNVLRKRAATINVQGKPTQIRSYNLSVVSNTDLDYDTNGLLKRIVYPPNDINQRYSLRYDYDSITQSYLTSVQDTFGYQNSNKFDYRFGMITTKTDIAGQQSEAEYDGFGRLRKYRGPNEISSSIDYLVKHQYWNDVSWSKANDLAPWTKTTHYDPEHPTDSIDAFIFTDGLGKILQTKKEAILFDSATKVNSNGWIVSGRKKFDDFGRVIESYYPIFQSTGNLEDFITSFDIVDPTEYTYDLFDRITKEQLPDNATTYIAYSLGEDHTNTIRFKQKVTDPNNIDKVTLLDYQGNITTDSAALSATTKFTYNCLGELIQSTDPDGYSTEYQYDKLGRVEERTHPDAGTTLYRYDRAGQLIKLQTANLGQLGQEIEYVFEFNRLNHIYYPLDSINNVHYRYGSPDQQNGAGRIVRIEDASGIQEINYGDIGEGTRVIRYMPAPGNTHLAFQTEWSYDSWNRVQTIFYPDGERIYYHYNRAGNMDSLSSGTGGNTYNILDSIGYDKFERPVYRSYGNGTKHIYAYDAQRGFLSSLDSWNSTGEMMQNNSYFYDNIGNIISIDNNAGQTSNGFGGNSSYNYTYDELNRLISAEGNWDNGPTYAFDLGMAYSASGGITNKTQSATILHADQSTTNLNYASDYIYGHPNKPHAVTEITGGDDQTFLWDENGNMSQHYYASTGITRYQCWDEVNRLIGVADGENISQYIYDAGGERAIKFYGQLSKVNLNKTTVIDYASMDSYRYYPNPYMVFGPSGYTKHYYIEGERVMSHFGDVYADGALISIHSEPEEGDMDEKASEIQAQLQTAFECFGLAGQYSYSMDFEWLESEPEPAIFFYHPDHLGSSGFITDASGLVDQHFEYLPFGELFIEERGNWNTPYKFSAKELDDESGYSYFGARYYDPNISIWLSVDPLSDEAPGWTPYRYAFNNPIRIIDPNGMLEDYYLNLETGQVEYHEGSQDRFDEGLVHLAGDDATVGDIESALAEKNYEYTKDHNTPGGFNVNTTEQYKAWSAMQIFSPENVGTILMLALGTGGEAASKARGVGQRAYSTTEKGTSLWPAAEGGEKVINGLTYTEHALERMQPVGTVMKGSGVASRGVPVSAVENAIKYGNVSPGNTAAEVVRTFENVRVITNPAGTRVISVIKLGH